MEPTGDTLYVEGRGVYIADSFDGLYGAYRPGATSGLERRNVWAAYRGRIVTWTAALGTARRLGDGAVEAEFVHVRNEQGIEARTVVEFPADQAERIFGTIPGQAITYQGRLERLERGEGTTTFFLSRGKIIRIDRPD